MPGLDSNLGFAELSYTIPPVHSYIATPIARAWPCAGPGLEWQPLPLVMDRRGDRHNLGKECCGSSGGACPSLGMRRCHGSQERHCLEWVLKTGRTRWVKAVVKGTVSRTAALEECLGKGVPWLALREPNRRGGVRRHCSISSLLQFIQSWNLENGMWSVSTANSSVERVEAT